MTASVPVSVVIPCFHDEATLEKLLDQLRTAASSAAVPLQIIVVDAARSEHCRMLCRDHQALWLPAEPCRGVQLRQGAALAEHDILWFLHADAELDGQPLTALCQAIAEGASGGYFAFRFSGQPGWQGRLLERLVDWRNQLGVPYGDQGLFARRSSYLAVGQHAPWPLFEEVPLVEGLRDYGDFRRIDHGLLVNPRRWQRDGWWRRSLRNRLLALGFALGVAPQKLAQLYAGRPSAAARSAEQPPTQPS